MAIRPDTDPKSATPRSGAPKGELEQYGVWVKAEPQDVIEEVAVPGSEDLDFDVPGDTASLPEESFLSEDEEKLLGSFDAEFEASSVSSDGQSGPLPDIEDMPALEESLLPPEPAPLIEEIEDIGSGSIDISLEDIESAHPASTIHPGADIDMDSIEGFDLPLAEEKSSSGTIEDVSSEFLDLADEPSQASSGNAEEVSDFGTGLDDVTSQFLDVEDAGSLPREAAPSGDFEPLDIDLQFDDSTSSSAGRSSQAQSPAEAGFEAVTEFDDFLSVDDSQASAAGAGFDDVSAVERDLSTPSPRSAPPQARAAEKTDLSTEILLKIAQELSSIRGELVSLKSKIGEAMVASEPPSAKSPEGSPEEGEDSGPSGGFFDDEEDETIALTGDELDNILNTADFTEEVAETEEPLDLESESLSLEMPSPESSELLDETLLPESGDYSATEPAIEEVRIGEADSVDEAEFLSDESEGLSLVAEQGVTPTTPAPEDTSYLEGAESFDLGGSLGDMPLSDEALVEPDLSDFNIEAEELEPRPEIDEELPLASPEPEADLEEMTLGIDAGPGYAAEEHVAEAEMIESLPEIEEPDFSEINLHEETTDNSFYSEPADLEEIEFLPDSDLGAQPIASEELPLEDEEDLVLSAVEEKLPPPKPKVEPRVEPKVEPKPAKPAEAKASPAQPPAGDGDRLKSEIKSVLSYLDKLLDSLPEEKIEEFARSEYFDTYKKLFEELGLV